MAASPEPGGGENKLGVEIVVGQRLSAGLMSSPGAVTEDSWQRSDSSLVRVICQLGRIRHFTQDGQVSVCGR